MAEDPLGGGARAITSPFVRIEEWRMFRVLFFEREKVFGNVAERIIIHVIESRHGGVVGAFFAGFFDPPDDLVFVGVNLGDFFERRTGLVFVRSVAGSADHEGGFAFGDAGSGCVFVSRLAAENII